MKFKQQRGVALITAVLIAALVAATAVAMASRQQLDIRRTANLFDTDRAYLFALGGESFARMILADDRRRNNVDGLDEFWAKEVTIPVEGAVLSGKMTDQQGLFNLNNLVTDDGRPSEPDIKRFEHLLNVLGMDGKLSRAVVDWIDPDIEPQFSGGAEDDVYMQLNPPYRAANGRMASPSELVLVHGFSYADYQKLAPFVTALPVRTKLNINTAPPELLATVVEGLTLQDGEALAEARGDKHYDKIEDFIGQPLLQNRGVIAVDLTVGSDYFLLQSSAEFDRGHMQLYSLLVRDDNAKIKVIMRGQGIY
ncbi:MAG: type II secretion system minor pseudopilin GspK [Gammaproteobacteria bacterium]|nr:type II secretion system minor pseudopilin GspK [Gammaproteobacteria bacterium]